MKSTMVKHPSNKGFTLVEMLLVLMIISVLLLIMPMLQKQQGILLRWDVKRIQELSIATQAEALRTHQQIPLYIRGNRVEIQGKTIQLHPSTSCSTLSFHYTAQGTISQAFTLRCQSKKAQVTMVAQLGSGRLDVR